MDFSSGVLLALFSPLGRSWGALGSLGALLDALEALFDALGALLGASWSIFESFFGQILAIFRVIASFFRIFIELNAILKISRKPRKNAVLPHGAAISTIFERIAPDVKICQKIEETLL